MNFSREIRGNLGPELDGARTQLYVTISKNTMAGLVVPFMTNLQTKKCTIIFVHNKMIVELGTTFIFLQNGDHE